VEHAVSAVVVVMMMMPVMAPGRALADKETGEEDHRDDEDGACDDRDPGGDCVEAMVPLGWRLIRDDAGLGGRSRRQHRGRLLGRRLGLGFRCFGHISIVPAHFSALGAIRP
jgi:hypothetical protein